MSEVYTTGPPPTTANPAERRAPASFRRQLEAVKSGVRIEQVAQEYGTFKLTGAGRLVGRCVAPDHEDRTPSMTIFTDSQRFKCFGLGCGAHGDVLELVQLAERCELWEAMMILATRYGIELPQRPPSWYRRQERQKPVRDKIEAAKVAHLQRRVFRIFRPMIEEIEDEAERREETGYLWRAAGEIAALIVAGRGAA